jgi:triacylglycerol lipase
MLAAVIAAEIAVYMLCGFWLASILQCSVLWGLGFATVFLLAARIAVVAASFALTYPYRSSNHIGFFARVRIYLIELGCFLALFTWLQPLERWLPRKPIGPAADARLPVVMVPGLYCNAGIWWWMRGRLSGWGVRAFAINLGPPLASLDQLAQQLATHVRRVCAETAAERVILVAHSMGGVVARTCMQRFDPDRRIAKIITLASPHHGSALARFAIGACGRALRLGSSWLAHLNASEHERARVPIVSIFTRQDNFVFPQDSSILPGATNVELSGTAHFSLLFSETVARLVYQEIVALKSGSRG